MAPPTIYGEPKITQDTKSGSVTLEVVAVGALVDKTKWYLADKELKNDSTYQFSGTEQTGNRKLLKCQIKNFEKSLAGEYKVVFFNSDGENKATFKVEAGNAPEFHDKPHIVQKDGGKIIQIKVRAKSATPMKVEWFKEEKALKATDRLKIHTKQDDKDKQGSQFILEIHEPVKEDQAKYKCVVKNAEGQNTQAVNLVFD